ncbi:MAG: sulfotransferase [Gemmataceae bacterium]|nr:sulfotransferase [Gemmataceae bacterium]
MTSVPTSTDRQAQPAERKREWAPRIWEGCDFFAWLRLLSRNRFAVHWSHLYIAVIVTFVSVFHTLLRFIQQGWYGQQVRRTRLRQAPLFIIGHWRTGTTLLHELLILDERHGYPTTYECLEPNHFLLTERFLTRWLRFLVPSRRPMDNMKAGFDRPQEDEFALCMLGQPSPYLTIAFPNHPPQDQDYLDFEGVPQRALERWKRAFYRFLQQITFKDPRRLVLKSPPHTGRIRILLDMFPDALFVHIVRNPYVVFASTVNLWKALYRTHSLQKPTFAGLEEYVYTTFLRLYDRLEQTRHLVPPGRFYELKYEDLVRDPVGQMRRLYGQLGLDGFERVLPRLQEYLASVAGYETNRYQLTPEQRAEVRRRWGRVIERYGYSPEPEPVAPPLASAGANGSQAAHGPERACSMSSTS